MQLTYCHVEHLHFRFKVFFSTWNTSQLSVNCFKSVCCPSWSGFRLKESIYSYFEKGCRKKCTRQSRKVLWVVLSSLSFKEIWKNDTRGHGRMFASAKGKQQKQVRHLQCQEQCIDHIPYYLSDLSRALFSDNLSRNSCMQQNDWKTAGTNTRCPLREGHDSRLFARGYANSTEWN